MFESTGSGVESPEDKFAHHRLLLTLEVMAWYIPCSDLTLLRFLSKLTRRDPCGMVYVGLHKGQALVWKRLGKRGIGL